MRLSVGSQKTKSAMNHCVVTIGSSGSTPLASKCACSEGRRSFISVMSTCESMRTPVRPSV